MQPNKIKFEIDKMDFYKETHEIVDEAGFRCIYLNTVPGANKGYPHFFYHERPKNEGFVCGHDNNGNDEQLRTSYWLFFKPIPERILVAKVPVYANAQGRFMLMAAPLGVEPYQLLGYATITMADVVPPKEFDPLPHGPVTGSVDPDQLEAPDFWCPVLENWDKHGYRTLFDAKKAYKNMADTPIGYLPLYLKNMVKNEEYAGNKK